MPRFLSDCFEQLSTADETPPAIAHYLRLSRYWAELGLCVSSRDLDTGAELWRSRSELRPVLAPHVLHTVSEQYRRAFRRAAEKHDELEYAPWLAAYPELGGQIEPFVIQRSKRFKQTQSAMRACLVWARHLGGDEPAWRQLADVWRWGWRNGNLRTEPNQHPKLSEAEAKHVNAHLADDERLEPFMHRLDAGTVGTVLQEVILAARGVDLLLGTTWSHHDDLRYAQVLRRLTPEARRRFRTQRCTKPLQRIAELAGTM